MTIDFTSQDALFGKNFTVYQNQMNEQKQQPPEIIEIGGVKYQRVVEPEKMPIPAMELLKDGSVFCVDYNNVTYYRQEYRNSNGWIKWWRENDEGGILTRVDDAETFRLLEKLFSADIAANPDGSLKFMFGPTLYNIVVEWWEDAEKQNKDPIISDLVDTIKEWLPSPQSAEGSQSLGVDDMVTGWNDCLERIKSKLS